MPQYMDRHAETGDGYESEPSRSQQRQMAANDDPVKRRPPGKKDPSLCKAAHWQGPHVPEFRLRAYPKPCRWWVDWTGKIAWACYHEQACAGCGKILLSSMRGRQCPDYREITAEETAVLESEVQARLDRIAQWNERRRKRPAITGPQGYRKPKGNA